MANGQEPSSDGNGRASSNAELRHSLSHSIHSELGPDSRRPGGQQSTSRPCSPPVLEPTAPPHARGTSREIRLKKTREIDWSYLWPSTVWQVFNMRLWKNSWNWLITLMACNNMTSFLKKITHTLYRYFFWDHLWWHPLTQRRSRRTLFLSLSYTGSKKTQCLSTHLGSKSGSSQRAWRCVQVFYLSGKTSKCAFMSTLFKTMLLPMHSKVGDCSILTRLEVDLILTCFYLTHFLEKKNSAGCLLETKK